MKPIIIDNFLPAQEFASIQKYLLSMDFPWYYSPYIAKKTEKASLNFYMIHVFFDELRFWSHNTGILTPIYKRLGSSLRGLIRAKANLYPYSSKLCIHPAHVDYPFTHKASLLYLNTNNGYTKLTAGPWKGTKIKSIANRCVTFDGSTPHSSTTCTDQKVRINIGINYF